MTFADRNFDPSGEVDHYLCRDVSQSVCTADDVFVIGKMCVEHCHKFQCALPSALHEFRYLRVIGWPRECTRLEPRGPVAKRLAHRIQTVELTAGVPRPNPSPLGFGRVITAIPIRKMRLRPTMSAYLPKGSKNTPLDKR